MLLGRHAECALLDRLVDAARGGESRALVVRGEVGVGKSALLAQLGQRAAGCRVVRAAGVQAERELAFAAVHQLCAPLLDRIDRIPEPQHAELATAFGTRAGPPPDRLLVSLAVLNLLAEAARERPLVCLVDDAQWLDDASAQVLAFVARHLRAESVVLVFAGRDPAHDRQLAGLPELVVTGLGPPDARALLSSVVQGPIDPRVRDRLVAETRGNPSAIVDVGRAVDPAALAGGFGLPAAVALPDGIADRTRARLATLPAPVQRLLLVAAADPTGDPALLWRAARKLDPDVDAGPGARFGAGPPARAGTGAELPAVPLDLVEVGERVLFRHPLMRAGVYRAASPKQRMDAHRALAEATDPDTDPDRRAWHRAHATVLPDEDVAAALERTAGRAQARAGLVAAAAFLELAATLTPDPSRGADRALAAAQAKQEAGAADAALGLLTKAEAGPLDPLQQARVELLRARIAFAAHRGRGTPAQLLDAARRLEPLDVTLARRAYLDALAAATVTGRFSRDAGLLAVAEAARAAPPAPEPDRAPDLLLDGLARTLTEGYAAGAPALRQALQAFRAQDLPAADALRWLWLAGRAARDLWDDESWAELTRRHVQLARDAGALAVLPVALMAHVGAAVGAGELATAATALDEVEAIAEATRTSLPPYVRLPLAALQGREAEALAAIESTMADVARTGEGIGLTVALWARAVLCNGLGRYEEALAAAEEASERSEELWFATHGTIELIEAAARTGRPDRAGAALDRLTVTTRASGTDLALGMEARSRALLSVGHTAERLHREAIDRLGRTRVRVQLARAHLVYGEWLRRQRRRTDARAELRTAHRMCMEMGLGAFAQRAAGELLATGETARKRTVDTAGQLTPQEARIARLARDRLSNPEIGARLFISPRTVEYHLRKVFTKLGISSRKQLVHAFPGEADRVAAASPVRAAAGAPRGPQSQPVDLPGHPVGGREPLP